MSRLRADNYTDQAGTGPPNFPNGINLITLYAILSEPFIPDTSQNIMLAVHSEDWSWPNSVENAL